MLQDKVLTTVEEVAEYYQCDVEQVLDLLAEGFTLQEAAEIIQEAEF